MGAKVLLAAPANVANLHQAASIVLPLPASVHPICDPLMTIQAFYVMMAKLAVLRGFNPDAPANLLKVTKTW
jgi:Predicted phosphosugar isomerases